ncbi:hypothetical protein G7054_g10527 [Neopestalotiopsis clavispora]|nr:hypothetical protein G7054_g10527 [Neopestalotiopsis clavispora]
MEAQLIAPDERLLRQIFDQYRPIVTVILQNRQKCIFKAELSEPGVKDASAQIVRLELMSSESEAFHATAILQQAAAMVLPDLVPKTQNVGTVEDCHGRTLHFSVTQFVEGDTLQDVWSKLSPSSQDSIVVELVDALERLHDVRPQEQPLQILKDLSSITDKELIEKISRPGVFGGPHTGFIDSGSALLASFMERRKLKTQFCSVEFNLETQSIHVRSNFEDLGSLIIHQSESDKWGKEAVLCHNDLTPRNLIIQQRELPDGSIKHHLAGIIDWELAGFYPPSYELSLQDTYLGTANQHLSFYLKLKSWMECSVPWCSSQIKLLKANELIYESQQRHLANGTNIPAHIRKRFMEYFSLVRDDDPYTGWVSRLDDSDLPEWSDATAQKMEDDVIQEMIAKRQKA